MNILISGGTGLIGREFINNFCHSHSFSVITRHKTKATPLFNENVTLISDVAEIDDIGIYDAVINLAGEPIADKRWTDTQKKIICDSRWNITSHLVDKINTSKNAPRVFLSGSAIGYYGNQGDDVVVENTPPHNEFTHDLCAKWESIANDVKTTNTRVVTLRTGVVLSDKGGALPKMALPFKFGGGGTLGSGNQYLAWIHLKDMINAIAFLLENDNCSGAFNLTAPEPVTNKVFSQELAKALHRPCLLNVPAFAMKILMGESSTMILEGQRVIPEKLTLAGFSFIYPTIESALNSFYTT